MPEFTGEGDQTVIKAKFGSEKEYPLEGKEGKLIVARHLLATYENKVSDGKFGSAAKCLDYAVRVLGGDAKLVTAISEATGSHTSDRYPKLVTTAAKEAEDSYRSDRVYRGVGTVKLSDKFYINLDRVRNPYYFPDNERTSPQNRVMFFDKSGPVRAEGIYTREHQQGHTDSARGKEGPIREEDKVADFSTSMIEKIERAYMGKLGQKKGLKQAGIAFAELAGMSEKGVLKQFGRALK